jgi:hypothetical protein
VRLINLDEGDRLISVARVADAESTEPKPGETAPAPDIPPAS